MYFHVFRSTIHWLWTTLTKVSAKLECLKYKRWNLHFHKSHDSITKTPISTYFFEKSSRFISKEHLPNITIIFYISKADTFLKKVINFYVHFAPSHEKISHIFSRPTDLIIRLVFFSLYVDSNISKVQRIKSDVSGSNRQYVIFFQHFFPVRLRDGILRPVNRSRWPVTRRFYVIL